jgi:pilus assembly protein CpaB
MRWGRGLVFVLALASAAGAAIIVRNAVRAPAPPAQPRPETAMAQVLVASRALAPGQMVEAKDLRWQPWPVAALPKDGIRRGAGDEPPAFTPAPARQPIAEGEPVTDAKLARPGQGGVMAAMIASGKRAVAVAVRDESAAGGFIQPLDRVDVLWSQRASDNGGSAKSTARTLLRGAKVLAIGKAIGGGGRDTSPAEGRTATLELTPGEARIVADARASGEISLALIPAADIAGSAAATDEAGAQESRARQTVQILKFGRQATKRQEQ